MLTLRFGTPYLSVRPFEVTKLPDFTLITGLNGSGKSHLLQAISQGFVVVDGVQNVRTEIRLFTWADFAPQAEGIFDGNALQAEQQQIATGFDASFNTLRNNINNIAQQFGLLEHYYANIKEILQLSLDQMRALFGDDAKASAAFSGIQGVAQQVSAQIRANLQSHPFALAQLERYAKSQNIPLAAIDIAAYQKSGPVAWGQVDMFQQSFSRLFVAYRNLALQNYVRMVAQQQGDPDASPLSPEAFIKKYNIPPWDFVNQTLESAGLPFTINSPKPYEHSPFQAKLRKKANGTEIDFQNLSSGEKILMSFANCLYYANDNRQIASFPKLLLLDEVDAPLHPSMSRTMIKIIKETLVERFGVQIIATTHSPSTLASAPEDSIYTMTAETAGLRKATKGKALNLLTAGVPTLAINASGRRQVFVESEVDCKIYDSLYGLLKDRLNSERSLSFMCAGTRSASGDVGNGGSQVKRIVSMLEQAQNHSVFGLVDWDGENISTERIKVIGEGARDGIENCLFDPLLVLCLICRDAHDQLEAIGLKRGGGLSQIQSLSADRLQEVCTAVANLVLGPVDEADLVQAKYIGGLCLGLRRDYLELDDHELEKKLFKAIPALRRYNQRAGMLMSHVVDNILPDFLHFLPVEPFEVLKSILDTDLEEFSPLQKSSSP